MKEKKYREAVEAYKKFPAKQSCMMIKPVTILPWQKRCWKRNKKKGGGDDNKDQKKEQNRTTGQRRQQDKKEQQGDQGEKEKNEDGKPRMKKKVERRTGTG